MKMYIILTFADPHLLESGQGSKNGTTNPNRVLSLGRSNNLDLHGTGCKSSNLLLHTISNTRIHGSTTRLSRMLNVNLPFCYTHIASSYHDNVGIQVLTNIKITLHDRIVDSLVNTRRFKTQEIRLEESFRSTEAE